MFHLLVKTYLTDLTRQRSKVLGCDWLDTRLQMTFFAIVNLANDGVCLYINDFESGLVSPEEI